MRNRVLRASGCFVRKYTRTVNQNGGVRACVRVRSLSFLLTRENAFTHTYKSTRRNVDSTEKSSNSTPSSAHNQWRAFELCKGQRKSYYEENEAEKKQNIDLIDTLKKEIKLRTEELVQARAVIGDKEAQVKKYLNAIYPINNKTADQIIHNVDLKVIEQRKMLDLLKYEKRSKKNKLKDLEKEYEILLIESTKSDIVKSKLTTKAKKHVSHLENEIHKVLVQWTEAELVKKKYSSIRQALIEDSVKFESSLGHIEELLKKQQEEINKIECVRAEAAETRVRAAAAAAEEAARAHAAEHGRAAERAYFAHRFQERRQELEKLEKRIFPPPVRPVINEETNGSVEADVEEEASAAAQMEEIFQGLMKLTGVSEPEEVLVRFRAQRETCRRLGWLQRGAEDEKLRLEQAHAALLAELEGFKFASVKDKDEGQDLINELKSEIEKEQQIYCDVQKKMKEVDSFLLEIKRILYDLCKLLDVIPEPSIPEWTAEARDIQDIMAVLTARFEKARARAEHVKEKRTDSTAIVVPSNTTSAAPSVAGLSAYSHSTPKESEKAIPTYKELLQREPIKAPVSDEEEDIPSRCYLKRQAQLIVDTKCRRKGFRPPYPRK
ncbi:Coiled-coil domain-containing protein 151 [Papilio machaon]|uniref:Coiled-coil domain-containing protein 151 n=1 Tax=Papilio machaon TaxID=76193 RepID=A0A194RF59_PAPMA|nr:Coiled-coil domain-containing protein 151 [Papilio machaon]